MIRKQAFLLSQVTGLIAGMCLLATLPAAAQDISTHNTSRYTGNRQWDWTIYIRAAPKILKDIRCVEYKLLPSFPKPVRKVCSLGNQRHPFGLSANSRGTFEISVKVIFKNNKTHLLKHTLKFEAPPVKDSLPITAGNVATKVKKGLWKWTVFVKGPEKVLKEILCIEYTLHHSFRDPVQEVCQRGKGDYAFALSATARKTFKIKIRIFLKDGHVQELTHDLKF